MPFERLGPPLGTEGQFFYSHRRWRGILKPSSVPLCVIQDVCLADIYKGREAFCEVWLSTKRPPNGGGCTNRRDLLVCNEEN